MVPTLAGGMPAGAAHYRSSIDQVAGPEGNRMCTERDGSRYHFTRPIDSASIAPDRVVHTLRGPQPDAHTSNSHSPGGRMSRHSLADGLVLSGGDRGVVAVVAVIALAALVVGYILLREVLGAGQGTSKMQEIAKAV